MERFHKPHTMEQIRQSSKKRKIRKKIERKERGKKRKCNSNVSLSGTEKRHAPGHSAEPEKTQCDEQNGASPSGVLSAHPETKNQMVVEKEKFYRHAVYFHSMWKKSEKPKELEEHVVKRGEKIGSGTFGVCFNGTFGSLEVCIKDFQAANEGIYEAKILQKLRHPNIPLFIGVLSKESGTYSVVTKFHGVKGTSLPLSKACTTDFKKTLAKPGLLMLLLLDVTNAIQYLHEREKILHNDIKANNVVLEESGDTFKAILIDFGKACAIKDGKKYRHKCDRQRYPHLAPEFAEGGIQSKASDTFSFGYMFRVVSHKLGNFLGRPIYKQCVTDESKARPAITAVKAELESFVQKIA